MLPHLIMVAKVVYPYMLLHVWVIKILPQPGHITPVEVPLSITVRKRVNARFKQRILWHRSWCDDKQPTPLTLWLQPNLVFGAIHQVWCWVDHICNARTFFPPWGDSVTSSAVHISRWVLVIYNLEATLTAPQFWYGHMNLYIQMSAKVKKAN